MGSTLARSSSASGIWSLEYGSQESLINRRSSCPSPLLLLVYLFTFLYIFLYYLPSTLILFQFLFVCYYLHPLFTRSHTYGTNILSRGDITDPLNSFLRPSSLFSSLLFTPLSLSYTPPALNPLPLTLPSDLRIKE